MTRGIVWRRELTHEAGNGGRDVLIWTRQTIYRFKPRGAMNVMVGRKRKAGARHPGGQLVRSVDAAPGAIKRLRDAALAQMQDSRWGTELGRLLLNHKISPDQYDAGCRWAGLAKRAGDAIGARVRIASGSDFTRVQSAPVDPESETGELEAKRHLMDMDRHQKAIAVLSRIGMPRHCLRAVRELCERDLALSFMELDAAREGLDALAEHFGLTKQGKSARLPK